ncbi:endonuclease domain-containing protein [Streptomyces sp. W1SF4]|uniref:endonuclease domain-containing protein n=2 Tax=Streptomyces TaxID=1883 RepID=UPI000F6EA0D5|nr:hypothetical protein D1J60_07700 [Streptomyces sp. W1SF4]
MYSRRMLRTSCGRSFRRVASRPLLPSIRRSDCLSDHQTGMVRGALSGCRAAMGRYKDRPDVMRRAAAYVEGNLWNPTLVAQGVYRQPS